MGRLGFPPRRPEARPVRLLLLLLLLALPAAAVPLHEAATAGNLTLVQTLIEAQGVKVDITNEQGETALCAAAREGHLPIVQYLVGKGANVNFQKVKATLYWEDLSAGSNGPLHMAVDGNHGQVVAFLLKQGAKVNTPGFNGNTPLHNAHSGAMAQQLLAAGADPKATNKAGQTALQYAVTGGSAEVVKVLLGKGGELEPTFLHTAATNGFDDLLTLLLDKGLKVDSPTADGWTPLMKAAQTGLPATVRLLLKRGADKTKTNKAGKTALDIAKSKRNKEVIELLK